MFCSFEKDYSLQEDETHYRITHFNHITNFKEDETYYRITHFNHINHFNFSIFFQE